jgi:hypothetical protein
VSGSILADAIRDGAVLCVRPKAMTVAVIIIGLLDLLGSQDGLGSHEPTRRADGRRRDYRTPALDVSELGRVSIAYGAAACVSRDSSYRHGR